MSAFLLVLAAAAPASGQCHRVHFQPDGTRLESWVQDDGSSSSGAASASSGGHSSANGSVTSHSSVSASSHSGAGQSSSTSSSSDGQRTITVTRDENGCTIVIDERTPAQNSSMGEPR